MKRTARHTGTDMFGSGVQVGAEPGRPFSAARSSSLRAVECQVSVPVTCRTDGGGRACGEAVRRVAMYARTIR
ncbi:hypothetical protein [Streptomyces sp. AC555_RSS877]|uniref:hypothetical protein n=1 Tax=Streptomyces sp. AC555_RSS877 TaxID=2823688 RepID=UPI001C260C69|nr:hypothetical protein [Streptomyces sp. AC555_RSS877]